ncbi:MAG: hypothetical protein FJ276_24670 [Planctomycetes bacterium]|nr:hypothetical protein [Planctomycetota bacterium]
MFNAGDAVRSAKFGVGQVITDDGRTVVVQFEHDIKRCLDDELVRVATPLQAVQRPDLEAPLPVVARVLGEAIQSVNDRWGVFSRSRITLLPHQLWVCRRVLESWPTRWLVADDVGLGKTIEAGMILMPVISRQMVQRLLIICPASLVEQWQQRLKSMFDIRPALYVTEADTKTSDFWHTHPQVVASLQTLRNDSNDRQARMLEAPPWDLVLVDEAHHLNADKKSGPTLGYRLLEKLIDGRRIRSLVFFTGTPHRGKNFGFLSLLRLLRADLFDPKRPLREQLAGLRQVMIRNNKQNVTDLKGTRLFQPPKVTSRTYAYSEVEAHFYATLTEFIATGKAYASTLSSSDQRTVILVLIAMQKLASSSVAAIRRALVRRLAKLRGAKQELSRLQEQRQALARYEESEEQGDTDELSRIEEQIAELVQLRLVADEEARLEELIAVADDVREETKISEIMTELDGPLSGRSVLFFTEYKATQSRLMSELHRKFGDACVAFINGDGRADEVAMSNGEVRTLVEDRETASARFNAGHVRFLVSTEAAGEGVDLQRQCYTLIHVDLPWNPMRLHQRVGRLYRYGQTRQVEVFTLRNPSTVESLIWGKLNEKIGQIMTALREVMEEPEDLLELVLGMTSPSLFRDVFAEAPEVPTASLSSWFNQRTATFGGQDVVDTVRDLVGHCARFDFQETSSRIPKLDLPALRPFFLAMLALNNRRAQETERGLSFKTPEVWLNRAAARSMCKDMVFSRDPNSGVEIDRILGVGHVLVDEAVRQARALEVHAAGISASVLPETMIVFRISEHVTSRDVTVRSVLAAARVSDKGETDVLQDWQLIDQLNRLLDRRTLRRDPAMPNPADPASLLPQLDAARRRIEENLAALDVSFVVPDTQLFALLIPVKADIPQLPDLPG